VLGVTSEMAADNGTKQILESIHYLFCQSPNPHKEAILIKMVIIHKLLNMT